jgi:hypothetical protein
VKFSFGGEKKMLLKFRKILGFEYKFNQIGGKMVKYTQKVMY